MKKGRSCYSFQLNGDINQFNQLIQNYMDGNNFQKEEKNGEFYYKAGNSMIGYRYFNYSLTGNNLTIYAWLHGAFGDLTIEQDKTNLATMSYQESLNSLFQEINKLNSNNGNDLSKSNDTYLTNQNMINDNLNDNQSPNVFQNEFAKKRENYCELAFWLSIGGLLASFLGLAYGAFIYIIVFYFASMGLKTKKRNKAIAAIVIAIISILIIIGQLILNNF